MDPEIQRPMAAPQRRPRDPLGRHQPACPSPWPAREGLLAASFAREAIRGRGWRPGRSDENLSPDPALIARSGL